MRAVAWLGAGLFVGSLWYFGYFYFVLLDRVIDGRGSAAAVLVDIALFSVFALHHSIFARAGLKTWVRRHAPPQLERSLYVWTSSLALIAVCALWQPVPGIWWEWHGWAAIISRAVQLGGIALIVVSAARIDMRELAGLRQAAVIEPHGSAGDTPLQVGGPYRWVRHPIYFAWLLMVFAAPRMTSGRLLFAVISTAYLVAAIPFEERGLRAEFGEPYAAYQRQVRWRIVPGIW